MPSITARGEWKLGASDCRRTSWNKELDGKELRGALGGERDLELTGFAVSRTPSTCLTHPSPIAVWYADFKVYPYTDLGSTVISRFGNSRVASLTLEARVVCSGKALCENPCIRGRCLFGEGGHRSRRVFDWG